MDIQDKFKFFEKIISVTEQVMKIPNEQLDMNDIAGHNGCGCAMYHGVKYGDLSSLLEWDSDARKQLDNLFAVLNDYPLGKNKGIQAKREFAKKAKSIIKLVQNSE